MEKVKTLPGKYKALEEAVQSLMSEWDGEHVMYEIVDENRIDVFLWAGHGRQETYISFRLNPEGNLEMLDGDSDFDNWISEKDRYSNWEVVFWRNAYFNK